MDAPPTLDPDDEIRLTLPAQADYARVARLAVAGLATRLDYTYDEVEDLRIAVGEVCSLLLDGSGGQLTFRLSLAADELRVQASRSPEGQPLVVTDLSRQILAAVVDDADIDPHHATVRVVKRRRG